MEKAPHIDELAAGPIVDAEQKAAYERLRLLRGSERSAQDVPRRREG